MKAWWIEIDEEWGVFLHAETRNKAKYEFTRLGYIENDFDTWKDIRALREKNFDDKPITYENMLKSMKNGGRFYLSGYDENGYEIVDKFFHNECCCEICKPSK